MDYREYSDEELIDLYREGDENIVDFILNKYEDLVKAKASCLYIIGGDRDDLLQEGRIALLKAVRDFDSGRDAAFSTFANLCIARGMYTAIQAADRLKHAPLNTYMSIYAEDFQWEGGLNPEENFLDKERTKCIEEEYEKELSEFEKQVIDLKIAGFEYKQIAAILGKSPKSTDNALQRIKTKIGKILENRKFSN